MKLLHILKSILKEAESSSIRKVTKLAGTKAQASQALKNAFKSASVSQFVQQFKKIASDPKVQAVLKAGLTDGNPNDEKVDYSKGSVKVTNLIPTQSEIGFDQSIENILTDRYGSLESILSGKADVGGPIVTYNDKYIIDGHHRWSQVFAANPNAEMQNLNIKGKLKPTDILKIIHASIAAKVGKVPSANPQGINILKGINRKQVEDAVNSKLTPKAKEIWGKHGYKDNEAISKHIFGTLRKLIRQNKPVQGAPGRKDMPQTDVGGNASDKLASLQKGIINFLDPKDKDIK